MALQREKKEIGELLLGYLAVSLSTLKKVHSIQFSAFGSPVAGRNEILHSYVYDPLGDDQMIVNGHAHQPLGLYQLPRDADVFSAGFRVARRMVVQADNRGGVSQNRCTKDSPRLDDARSQTARRDL